MKDFFKYTRLFVLRQPGNISLSKIVFLLFLVLLLFFNISDDSHIELNIFLFVVIASIGLGVAFKNMFEEISLISTYPIHARKRVLYNFVYTLMVGVKVFITLIIFGLTLFGIIYLFNSSVFSTEEINMTEYPLFYYALFLSLASFLVMTGHIKNNKKWWITIFSGFIGFFGLVVIMSLIFDNNLKLGNLANAILNDKDNIFHYIISGLLFISVYGFFELAVRMYSHKKPNN